MITLNRFTIITFILSLQYYNDVCSFSSSLPVIRGLLSLLIFDVLRFLIVSIILINKLR